MTTDQRKLTIALEALRKLAAFTDESANARFINTKSYASFDKPGAVKTAREALRAINHIKD